MSDIHAEDALRQGETDRRGQIIAAAGRAFARKGYHGTTIRDIAAEAQLAPGTLYLYFDSKRAILTGFFDHALGLAEERARGLGELSLEEALQAFFSERLQFMRRHIGLVKVIFAEAMFDDELRARVRQNVVGRIDALLGRLLTEWLGHEPDPEHQQTIARSLQAQLLFWGVLAPSLGLMSSEDAQGDAGRIAAIMTRGIEDIAGQ